MVLYVIQNLILKEKQWRQLVMHTGPYPYSMGAISAERLGLAVHS
jgi:hypothetical protein